jgi:hypothetical protein
LSEREDAFPCIGFDFFVANAKEAQIALFHGLLTATLAELAHIAVIVQDQRRRLVRTSEPLNLSDQTACFASVC